MDSLPDSLGNTGLTHHPPPRPVACHGSQDDAPVRPICHIPHVLGEPFGLEVVTAPAQFAWLGAIGRAAVTLELKLDE